MRTSAPYNYNEGNNSLKKDSDNSLARRENAESAMDATVNSGKLELMRLPLPQVDSDEKESPG